MIPTIERIVEELLAGTLDKRLAIDWLNQHAEQAMRDLRDDFAMAALSGIAANSIPGSHHIPKNKAREAYELADLMMAERHQPQSQQSPGGKHG